MVRGQVYAMNAESIRELLHHQPFTPFEVHLTNGEVYVVSHPEVALLAGARLLIYYPENDKLVYCALLHIADIVIQQRRTA